MSGEWLPLSLDAEVAERLATIGQFSTLIAHEIRSPLTTIAGVLHHFQKLELPKASKERLSLALDEAECLERLMSEILLFARPFHLQKSAIDLERLVCQTVETFQAAGHHISFTSTGSARVVQADSDRIKQVLINIGRNACEAVSIGDRIIWSVNWSCEKSVELCVNNGGKPIAPEDLARLTEPFFSSKPTRSGLGLAIVKRVIEAHSGELTISSDPQTGTTVKILLPTPLELDQNQTF